MNRNQGLGQKLLEFVLNAAARMLYSEITLGVDFDNANAIYIYKKYGFKIFEKAEDEQGVYFKMIKNLTDAEIVIEKMSTEDFDVVYSLWMQCNGIGLNDTDDSSEGFKRFINRNPDTCFIAKISNITVGTILAGNDGRRGYIYHTAVHPQYRHKGIGTKLVHIAINSLKQMGIGKAALLVFSDNESGNKFWSKLGFTERDDLIYRNYILNKLEK